MPLCSVCVRDGLAAFPFVRTSSRWAQGWSPILGGGRATIRFAAVSPLAPCQTIDQDQRFQPHSGKSLACLGGPGARYRTNTMVRRLLHVLSICSVVLLAATAFADDRPTSPAIQEEVWA